MDKIIALCNEIEKRRLDINILDIKKNQFKSEILRALAGKSQT